MAGSRDSTFLSLMGPGLAEWFISNLLPGANCNAMRARNLNNSGSLTAPRGYIQVHVSGFTETAGNKRAPFEGGPFLRGPE